MHQPTGKPFSTTAQECGCEGAKKNEPMTTNPKDGCQIKGMMKGVKYEMFTDTLQSRLPR